MHNVEIGVVWRVKSHSRSLAMSPIDQTHTTSYSTMHPSCSIFKL